jgi:hypothetical protein
MIYIETGSTDVYYNFGLENYFATEKRLPDTVFLFWRTTPTLMVGKYQNILEEINKPYADAHGIHLVRRMSGGGAVYLCTEPYGQARKLEVAIKIEEDARFVERGAPLLLAYLLRLAGGAQSLGQGGGKTVVGGIELLLRVHHSAMSPGLRREHHAQRLCRGGVFLLPALVLPRLHAQHAAGNISREIQQPAAPGEHDCRDD